VLALVDSLEKEQERFVMADEFASMYKIVPFYEKRREKLKSIPNFWTTVLQNDTMFFRVYGNHPEDLEALKYLEDIHVSRHKPDPRAYTLEFHFKENPFFSDKVLSKEYKLKNAPSGEVVDGIYDSMLSFNPDRDIVVSSQRINWKNDKMNLCKKYPLPAAVDEDDDMGDGPDQGSFFNFFESIDDELEFGAHFAGEIFASPIMYFKGEVDEDEEDDEISSSEDGDSDADEIDLERPKKRSKHA